MSPAESFRQALPMPHRAGWPFILSGLIAMLVGLVLAHWLFWLALLFTLFSLFFFRDPERVPPDRASAILAPADGRVVSVAPAAPPPELGLGVLPRWRVSIFLSVLNVHVNRIPSDGTVTRIAYRHGAFLNASLDKASEANERNAIALRLLDGQEIAVVQIAGLIARRILCDLREGDAVQAGARFGIIRFGSRTDLYLPEGVRPLVVEGQTMVGGETVVAELLARP
jgi:phosphatidylserine decarboxylase